MHLRTTFVLAASVLFFSVSARSASRAPSPAALDAQLKKKGVQDEGLRVRLIHALERHEAERLGLEAELAAAKAPVDAMRESISRSGLRPEELLLAFPAAVAKLGRAQSAVAGIETRLRDARESLAAELRRILRENDRADDSLADSLVQ